MGQNPVAAPQREGQKERQGQLIDKLPKKIRSRITSVIKELPKEHQRFFSELDRGQVPLRHAAPAFGTTRSENGFGGKLKVPHKSNNKARFLLDNLLLPKDPRQADLSPSTRSALAESTGAYRELMNSLKPNETTSAKHLRNAFAQMFDERPGLLAGLSDKTLGAILQATAEHYNKNGTLGNFDILLESPRFYKLSPETQTLLVELLSGNEPRRASAVRELLLPGRSVDEPRLPKAP